jgi:hypothetical protein
VVGRNSLPVFLAIVASLAFSGCELFNPNRQNWIYGGSSTTQVLLVFDSPEVRRLIAHEDTFEDALNRFWRDKHTQEERNERIQDMMRHPERYPVGRAEFLDAMAKMPGLYVPAKSYCRVIERSMSRCGRTPIETSVYMFVRITTGPSQGKRGWVCGSNAPELFP